MGILGHEENTDGTDTDSGTAFDNEKPSPTSNAMSTVELEDCSCKETSEGITDLLRDVETGETLAKFSFGVPLEKSEVSIGFEERQARCLRRHAERSRRLLTVDKK